MVTDIDLSFIIPTHNENKLLDNSLSLIKEIIINEFSQIKVAIIITSSGSIYPNISQYICNNQNLKIFYRKIHFSNFWCANVNNSLNFLNSIFKSNRIILMNDDTILDYQNVKSFISSFLHSNRDILVGKVHDRKNNLIFGARLRKGFLNHKFILSQDCSCFFDTFNANFVGLSEKVLLKINGFSKFSHAFGDYDFGLRAIKNGFTITQFNDEIGYTNESNTDRSIKFKSHIKKGIGRSNFKDFKLFYGSHFSLFSYSILLIYFKIKTWIGTV